MNTTRQDAWTKDEDTLLAEIVLRYIREGRTQLEAFKEVAKRLSRTSAACGFRWNATIRKQYAEAIQFAKQTRKSTNQESIWSDQVVQDQAEDPIDRAILLLKSMKFTAFDQHVDAERDEETVKQLEKENKELREALLRYDDAWNEMGKLWKWVKG